MASVEGPSPTIDGESSMAAGEFVLKKLFAEFVALSDRKLQAIATQQFDYQLGKALQKGEDPHFDQLLNALNEVASFCLRSILTSIFKWRDMQIQQCRSNTSWSTLPSGDATDSPYPANRREKEYLTERQELAIEFIFCLVLIEVLTKLTVHPVPESFIHTIEDYAFKHFKLQETLKESRTNFANPNVHNMKKIADLYAEVIGVLSQSRFHSVRKKFFLEIRDPQNNSTTIINIIEGMSFIRVKMFPVDDLEHWFNFLQECASYFLECRDKIKHAMSALLVEILLPVAAVIKFEASLPCVKKFVSILFSHCFEQAKRVRHSTAYIPLVTVLLAISEQKLFLSHWHTFVQQVVVPSIRKGGSDSKLQRTALEALNRLVWVYMVRIKGESNITTHNRLRSIADFLFPRGQRGVQPKDMPLNIFVKLIQFIARERLEYAMHEILDLLNMGRTRSTINPERMVIGLRAFLVITDSLEKKEGEPPMPLNAGPPPSGGPTRVKTKFLSTTITDATAKKIGIAKVYPQVRRALDCILRALDHSVGKSFLSTNVAVTGKSEEEMLGGVKPKLDLLKTCVAAIPRIMPEGMTRDDLIDLLSRFTIHIDHELVRTTFSSLQSIINNFPAWRHDVTRIFARFILRDIPDSCPLVLDSALKMLIQMITHWKTIIITEAQSENTTVSSVTPSTSSTTPSANSGVSEGGEAYYCVPWVEACALVTLCSYRSVTRKLSLVLLKETRVLHETLKVQTEHTTVMDVIEKTTPSIIKRYLATLTQKERMELRLSHQSLTLQWMAERSSCFLEQGGSRDSLRDAWAQCLAGLLEPHLLPEVCPTSVHIAWPYVFQRMGKAYAVLDPGGVAPERGERPPSIKGRRPVISSPEMFLWRNYLMFVSCTAPPSTSLQGSLMSSGDSSILESISGRVPHTLNARNLFHKVVPLVRSEGEIREVAITALGLIHPNAFGDLVEELNSVIHDALDQRRGDKTGKKKRQRDTLRVQITRVFALTAEHGCFRQSPMTRTDKGEVSPVFLEFIEGIKICLETESVGHGTELRLYFAALIANMINSLPVGEPRLRLFSPEMRYNLFYLFANWCGLFGPVVLDPEQEMRRNPRASALSFNALQAMSALLCCGPVFRTKELERESNIYRWLENMLSSGEPKVQTLGRKTVQMLLQNNNHPTLLPWVIDRCYDSKPTCAQLCFHALSSTLAEMPTYPCEMVTVLHVVLFKTADLEYSTRERATHLLQILDRRFFVASDEDNETGGRTELLGCLTTGAYSQCHMTLSRELALANPELTLPMFCEMVYRYEMASRAGKRSILEYMVPWLQNVELIEDAHLSHPHIINQSDYPIDHLDGGESYHNPVLKGNGWGSIEGTKVVLHNLLYITAKYGDDHIKEVEALWSALCMWPQNIRATLNYLGRLTCVSGNLSLMLQQAKRIMVCLSRSQIRPIVTELIKDLQSVELISSDIQVTDSPPYYHVTTSHGTMRHTPHHGHTHTLPEGMEGTSWAVAWRIAVRIHGCPPVPLPLPFNRQHFVNMREILRAPNPKPIALHRCNFALILLSELVVELHDVDWSPHLPLLLHVVILGLDLYRPLVFEHSKKLLGNLLIVLACQNDKMAALQARFAQQEVALRSFSASSLSGEGDPTTQSGGSRSNLHLGSIDSLHDTNTLFQSALSMEAKELIHFVASRDTHRPPWPFADLNCNRLNPNGQVVELNGLVSKILQVFQHVSAQPLKEKWTMIALQWATSCSSHQYASQSFQVCRALQLPLTPSMLREVLTRLAESASEEKEDMQSYVLEIVLTMESAVDFIEEDHLMPSNALSPRKVSDLPPLPSDLPDTPYSFSPPPSADSGACAPTGSVGNVGGVKRRHSRGRSVSNKSEMVRPSSAKAKIDHTQATQEMSGLSSRSMSPVGPTIRETQRSPIVPPLIHLREHEVGVSLPTRPHSTIVQSSRTAPIAIPEGVGNTIPINAHQTPVSSPQKSSPLESVLQESHLTPHDGGAAPAGSASAPDTKQPKEMDAVKETISTPVVGVAGGEEKESRSRKVSEPPPSLQAIFDHGMASSRRWMNKQLSADIAHPKQHSLDNTHLKSVTPQSPKLYGRRVKSPSASDKNNRLDIAEGVSLSDMQRTPSHPHLHSPHSTSQISSVKSPMHDPPIARAHSTQQLQQDIENEGGAPVRSNSMGKADSPTERLSEVQSSSLELKNEKDREIFQSKESLKDIGLLKKSSLTVSRESLRSSGSITLKEIPTSNSKDGGSSTTMSDVNKENRERVGPSKSLQVSAEGSTESLQAPQQVSTHKSHIDLRRRNSSQQYGLFRKETDSLGVSGKKRPRSMIETSSYRYGPSFSSDTINPPATDLLAQLFCTATSLLESDYEGEYLMAQRLLSKVLDHLELNMNDTYERLEALLDKMRWSNFPGIQAFLLKGLTLESTSEPSRTLLSRITLHSTRFVFDPSQYAGLPLNVMSLMPVLIHHFEQPTDFCIKVVSNIQQACTSVDLPSEESKTKLVHMSKMFQMYATRDFPNGVDLWLAGICRYLNDAYPPLAVKMLSLLADMLDKGCVLYHKPILRLLYEYTRLQDPNSVEIKKMADTIMTVATQHVKGVLWKEALDLIKLAVSNSASLVQPPTRGLPVDLGLFNQTLPGPTLQFSMDLQHGSNDLGLADSPHTVSSWRRPQACQRRTRERLLSVLNACGPGPVLMSSPSVVFTDEQALIGDKGTLYSSTSEEAASSIADEIIETSQPESQVYITAVGNEFDFLNDFEYKYDQSSNESDAPPGPFTRPSQALDVELEEREEDSSLPGSLMGSRQSLVESAAGEDTEGQVESDDHELEESASPPRSSSPKSLTLDLNQSPDKSPDVIRRHMGRRHTSPEKSPLIFRKSHPQIQRKSYTQPSDLGETSQQSHDMSPDQRRSRDVSPNVRHGSFDKSPDSKETSPQVKRGKEKSQKKQIHRLSQHQGSSDSQTEQQPLTLVMPDASLPFVDQDRENDVPLNQERGNEVSVDSSSSEALSTEVSPQRSNVEHMKSESVTSDNHSQQSSGEGTELTEHPPEEDDTSTLTESTISPTLKVSPSAQLETEDISRLQEMSEDSLGEIVLEMVASDEQQIPSHDRSSDQQVQSGDQYDESCEQPVQSHVESGDQPAKSHDESGDQPVQSHVESSNQSHSLAEDERTSELSPTQDNNAHVVVEGNNAGREDTDCLGPEDVLAQLDQVLDLEDLRSESVDEDEQEGEQEPSKADVPQVSPAPDTRDVSTTDDNDLSDSVTRSHDPGDIVDSKAHDQESGSHNQSETSHAGGEESHDSPKRTQDLPGDDDRPNDEEPVWEQDTPPENGASRFLDFSADEIEEAWHDHVTALSRDKSPITAVHTYFLFDRLLSNLRLQFCNLTREACNYLGNGYKSIASHFLVTTEVLLSEFEIPKVYIDAEMIIQSELLERIVFVVLELDDNLSTYTEKKKSVQEALNLFKQALRQASSASQEQAAVSLCRAVHKFHFQLLVLLGSYVKLMDMLQSPLEKCAMTDMCLELTEVIRETNEAMLTVSRGPSPPFDDHSEREVGQLVGVADAVRVLEDALSQKQYLRAVQLLHTIRKNWKDNEVFGSGEEDDVHCLFFIYARYITDQQEGILCITNTEPEHKLSKVHATLMSQNVSLHSLLEQYGDRATPPYDGSHDDSRKKETTPPRSHDHARGRSRTLPEGYFEHSV